MVTVNELKGINLSKRYYDPTRHFVIENESHKFCSKPNDGQFKWLKYEFQSDYYNTEFSTSNFHVFNEYNILFNRMWVNRFRINLIKNLFSDYEDVNFIDLFFDLKEIPNEIRLFSISEDETYDDLLLSHYKSALEE